MLARARLGRWVTLSPAGPVESAHTGEPGNSLLYLGPAVALGRHAMLQYHGGTAFAHTFDIEAAPADVYQSLLTVCAICCRPIMVCIVCGISRAHRSSSSFSGLAWVITRSSLQMGQA